MFCKASTAIFFTVALAIRFLMIYIAKVIDESPGPNKYTDTDYEVFSDAATHVYNGGSPYARHTYRYTPLAAYICLVNNVVHPLAGKVVFSLLDLVMGALYWHLVKAQKSTSLSSDELKSNGHIMVYVGLWLFNPMIIGLSSRGSNDNIISLLVFVALYYLLNKKYVAAGFWYGLSVHFKIYPIIYSFVFYLFIDSDSKMLQAGKPFQAAISKGFFTRSRLVFTFVSAATFISFTGLFYYIYGWEFLYESYLYHFVRKDHRHNNSVYWYLIYQLFDEPNSTVIGILTFIPQWLLTVVAGFLFYYDLWLCMLLQTWSFVIFNKVMTAQYYLWYLTLMPIAAVNSPQFAKSKSLVVVGTLVWALGQVLWGISANDFETWGEPTLNDISNTNLAWCILNILLMMLWLHAARPQLTHCLGVQPKVKAE